MPQISWDDFKRSHPTKFELLMSRLIKDRGISRSEAIDVLDEEFTFEGLPEGAVRVTNDTNGRYSTMTPPEPKPA
jgi:hypothetical protein